MTRMLEDAKVERLPMRLNAPGDSMTRFNINPTNKVGLEKPREKTVTITGQSRVP